MTRDQIMEALYFEHGVTGPNLARFFGITKARVYQLINRFERIHKNKGLPRRVPKHIADREARRLKALWLVDRGWKYKDVGYALDVSPATVCEWVYYRGVEARVEEWLLQGKDG